MQMTNILSYSVCQETALHKRRGTIKTTKWRIRHRSEMLGDYSQCL